MIVSVSTVAPDTRCGVWFEDLQCPLPAFVSFYNGEEMAAPAAVCSVHVAVYLAELVGADL